MSVSENDRQGTASAAASAVGRRKRRMLLCALIGLILPANDPQTGFFAFARHFSVHFPTFVDGGSCARSGYRIGVGGAILLCARPDAELYPRWGGPARGCMQRPAPGRAALLRESATLIVCHRKGSLLHHPPSAFRIVMRWSAGLVLWALGARLGTALAPSIARSAGFSGKRTGARKNAGCLSTLLIL